MSTHVRLPLFCLGKTPHTLRDVIVSQNGCPRPRIQPSPRLGAYTASRRCCWVPYLPCSDSDGPSGVGCTAFSSTQDVDINSGIEQWQSQFQRSTCVRGLNAFPEPSDDHQTVVVPTRTLTIQGSTKHVVSSPKRPQMYTRAREG